MPDTLSQILEQTQVTASPEFHGEVRKMMIILSKASIENVYAAFILANGARMEGIECEIFFTFFGLDAITKKKLDHLHVATVGNPAMHIPTMLGGLPGMETLATKMMVKEMDKLDIPPVSEFLEILKASGVKLWACRLAMDMFHLTKDDMIDDLDGVLTVGDFYQEGSGLGTHMLFV
jgi:peroxiredoxin family protein